MTRSRRGFVPWEGDHRDLCVSMKRRGAAGTGCTVRGRGRHVLDDQLACSVRGRTYRLSPRRRSGTARRVAASPVTSVVVPRRRDDSYAAVAVRTTRTAFAIGGSARIAAWSSSARTSVTSRGDKHRVVVVRLVCSSHASARARTRRARGAHDRHLRLHGTCPLRGQAARGLSRRRSSVEGQGGGARREVGPARRRRFFASASAAVGGRDRTRRVMQPLDRAMDAAATLPAGKSARRRRR